MNEHELFTEEALHVMREVDENPDLNQRLLSQKLNISLGKANYLLKELAKKGLIKFVNFSHNSDKTKKLKYILTKKGMNDKITLTYHFLKTKEREYKRLKNVYEGYVAEMNRKENGRADRREL